MMRLCFLTMFPLVVAVTMAPAADWPRFRGPNGTGIATGPLPTINPQTPLWRTELPGKGNGSPIVVNSKVYLQAASDDGSKRYLVCIDAATGKIEWTKEQPGAKGKTHAKNSLASGTPASDGTHLYCQWWDGSGVSLHAYDLTGKELWRVSLGSYVSQHGPGFSPMVHNGLVFVNVDDDQHAELIALDAKTGDKKWIADRRHYRACYPTPFLLERPGQTPELILGTTTALTSYDPASGNKNWEYTLTWPKGEMPLRVIGHPVFVAGLVVLYCGDGGGSRYMVAVDPNGKKPAKVWELKKDTPYVPCVLVKEAHLFWIGDKGTASCVDGKTGKTVWTERIFSGDVTASPVMIDDTIIMISEKGEIAALKAATTFEEPTKVNLGEKVMATPAVVNGTLFIRGEKHLFAFGQK